MDKKKWIISGSIVSILIIILLVFLFFFKEDKNTTMTLSEKTWVENKQNETFRLEILPNIYMLDKDGTGVFFDFLNDFEEDVKLKFHRVTLDENNGITSDYALLRVDKKSDTDLLFYQDSFVLVSSERIKYTDLDELPKLVVGVEEKSLETANSYLRSENLTFKTYEKIEDLVENLDTNVDAMVMSKLDYLKYYDENNELYVNYNIIEMTEDYVIRLSTDNDRSTLNNIIKKYYNKWKEENYQESYETHFTNTFFEINEIDEQSKVKFRSKRYVYAYVENAPYDKTVADEDYGINPTVINSFAELSKIEVSYEKYKTVKELETAFQSNKIDIYFDSNLSKTYDMDVYETISPFKETLVVASRVGQKLSINSIKSLADKEVVSLSKSSLNEYLSNNQIKTKSYSDYKTMFKKIDKEDILTLDLNTYNYYSKNELDKYKIDYQVDIKEDVEYTYLIRDIQANEIFIKYFDFYLTMLNEKDAVTEGLDMALNASDSGLIFKLLIIFVSIIIVIILVLFSLKKMPFKKKSLTKEDKLKYVDILTSLKNRNYLNDNIEKWDESEIYPQTIIIIDLNNVAYINDNYGHSEGDNVIKEAANILITNQMPNSEIIRTNGNEFLIYLVEYDEKQIVSYIKKLNKELKELSHGFGAAIGYSMISDAIKTIDDAVNEATLDMKNNKEELNN